MIHRKATRFVKWFESIAFEFLMVMGVSVALSHDALGQNNAPDPDAMFRMLDVNKDGKLTKGEVGPNARGMIDHVFRLGDKPDSGSMTREEFQTVFEKHRAGGAGASPQRSGGNSGTSDRRETMEGASDRNGEGAGGSLLSLLDGNSDQRLTRSEFGRIVQMFDRFDTNKDGSLDMSELQAIGRAQRLEASSESRTRPNSVGNGISREGTGQGASANTASSSTSTDGRGTASRLQGVWRGWVVRGKGENPNEGEMEIELTVDGNRMTGRELGTRRGPAEGLGSGNFTMTGNGRTGTLDADGTSGSQDGRHSMGIYELDGETLKWCVTQRGRQRPSTMETDRGNYLLVLRKQTSRQ